MSDRAGASVGFACAGVAAAVASATLPAGRPRLVALGGALLATLSFFFRRHDLLDRPLAVPLAAVGSVGTVAARRVWAPRSRPWRFSPADTA